MRRSAGNPINFFQNISHLPGQSSLLFCIDLIEYNIKAAIPYSLPSTGFTCKQLCQKFRCQLRILRQVNIENAAEADRIFSMLMGDEVPPRREFIERNAHYANIDA